MGMSESKSNKAEKAAATRRRNAELERMEAEQLLEETRGGRSAKHDALKNPVWGKQSDKRRAVESSSANEDQKNKRKKGSEGLYTKEPVVYTREGEDKRRVVEKSAKTVLVKASRPPAPALINDDSDEDDEPAEEATRKKRSKYRPPAPALINDDSSDQGDEPAEEATKKKRSKHQPPAPALINDDSDEDDEPADETTKKKLSKYKVSALKPTLKRDQVLADDSDSSSSGDNSVSSKESGSDGLSGALEPKLRRMFDDERPRFIANDTEDPQAIDIFDIPDTDVEMASTKSRSSSRSASHPPYTDSEPGLSPGPSDDEKAMVVKSTSRKRPVLIDSDAVSGDEEVPKPRKKVKKARGRREEAFASERPTIQAPTNHVKKERTPDVASLKWPKHACIVLPPPGKEFALLAQNSLIRAIIRKAIASLTDELVLCQAWPDAGMRSAYGKKLVLGACQELMKDTPKIKDIKLRIKEDEDFANELGEITVTRLSTLRFPAKKYGGQCVPYYKLGLGKECMARAESLSRQHTYVFPGTWGGEDGNTWEPNKSEPFLHQALIDTLKNGFFFRPSSLGYKYVSEFKSSIAGNEERELPIPLVALSATGVYHGIYEYKTGIRKETNFDGNTFISTYTSHVRTLEKMKAEYPTKFHYIMSKLYKLVVSAPAESGTTTAGDVFDLIDF